MRYNYILCAVILTSCNSKKSKPKEAKSINFETNTPAIIKTIYGVNEKYDSTNFFIILTQKGFKVEFLGKTRSFENSHLLDRYIYENKLQIDTNKIFVSVRNISSQQDFNDLKEILKVNGIPKFRLR